MPVPTPRENSAGFGSLREMRPAGALPDWEWRAGSPRFVHHIPLLKQMRPSTNLGGGNLPDAMILATVGVDPSR